MSNIRTIIVTPYTTHWLEQFRQEAAKITAIFGPELISIYHIGSTSIPGMSAKPIIDIMPVVHTIEKTDPFNSAMRDLGYDPRGEYGIPGRRYFSKGEGHNRSHHVHTYALDNPDVKRHLDFRDYLIAHPEEAQQYATLKTKLARQFPHDIDAYMAGKEGFIQETIQKAHQWRTQQTNDITP